MKDFFLNLCSPFFLVGAMAFQCRACRYPLRLDRGSSRCIPCCHTENGEDCCHCDDKRHSTVSTYNGKLSLPIPCKNPNDAYIIITANQPNYSNH